MPNEVKTARATLGMVWTSGDGDEIVPGISIYGLAPKDGYSHRSLPMEIWPNGCAAQHHRFVGENWEMPAWNIRIPDWPDQRSWPGILRNTLGSLIESGCSVAWLGTEFEMCSPPDLFDPDCMSGVGAALTADRDFVCTVDLDRPLADVTDEQMVRLRHYAKGLADVE